MSLLVQDGTKIEVIGVVGAESILEAVKQLSKRKRDFEFLPVFCGMEPAPRVQPAGLPPGVVLGPQPRFIVFAVFKSAPPVDDGANGNPRLSVIEGNA